VAVATIPPGEPVVSQRIMLFYVLLAIALVPQIVMLAVTLPDRAVIGHWTLAWAGFAILVAFGLLATAVCVLCNSPWTVVAASATGVIVFVDAWFDLMTRQGADDFGPPVVRVLLLKLPLGVLCMVATVAVIRRLSTGRSLIGRAGLGWRDGAFVAYGPPVAGDQDAERLAEATGAATGPGRLVDPPLVAPWVVRVYLVAAVLALLSLIVVTRHPSEALATNWTTAWVGFDLLMAAAFVVTVFAARRRSLVAIAALAADAAILLCDGWFDTMTAHGRTEMIVAVFCALAVELPLAVFSLLIARRAVVRIAAARSLLARADVSLP
jgi:hypothetical protein